jgi:GTP pyrophosphokinase
MKYMETPMQPKPELETNEDRKNFLIRLEGIFNSEEINLIDLAYDLAKEAHRTQKRDGGGRYFEHPRACALIALDELDIRDPNMIIAALLHDTAEDTPIFGNVTRDPSLFMRNGLFRLTQTFNEDVADMVMALTKLKYGEGTRFLTKDSMLEFYFQNLLNHPKAVILKAIDRLHNLRTLPPGDRNKIVKQIKETKERIIPMLDVVKGSFPNIVAALSSLIGAELSKLESSLVA